MKDPASFLCLLLSSHTHSQPLCVCLTRRHSDFVIKDQEHVLFVWTDMPLQIIMCERERESGEFVCVLAFPPAFVYVNVSPG